MAKEESLVGRTLGGYEIRRMVGRGGMAIVYEGLDKSSSRKVAIKVLPKSFLTDEETVKRFDREAAAVAKLNHPNVIKVYHTGEEGGFHYFVRCSQSGNSWRDCRCHRCNHIFLLVAYQSLLFRS